MNRDFAGIIASPLVGHVRELGYDISSPSFRFYPDGSLRWEGINEFSKSVLQSLDRHVPGAIMNCCFRPLAAFGGGPFLGTAWTLTLPGTYGWFLTEFDEAGMALGPGDGRLVSVEERDVARLPIFVKLHRRVTRAIAIDLAAAVRRWFADVGSRGIFGDAGISSISSAMRYRGCDVCFELDARNSGPETLNTLYLAVVNWGMSSLQPLSVVDLAGDRYERVFTSVHSVPLA